MGLFSILGKVAKGGFNLAKKIRANRIAKGKKVLFGGLVSKIRAKRAQKSKFGGLNESKEKKGLFGGLFKRWGAKIKARRAAKNSGGNENSYQSPENNSFESNSRAYSPSKTGGNNGTFRKLGIAAVFAKLFGLF